MTDDAYEYGYHRLLSASITLIHLYGLAAGPCLPQLSEGRTRTAKTAIRDKSHLQRTCFFNSLKVDLVAGA